MLKRYDIKQVLINVNFHLPSKKMIYDGINSFNKKERGSACIVCII